MVICLSEAGGTGRCSNLLIPWLEMRHLLCKKVPNGGGGLASIFVGQVDEIPMNPDESLWDPTEIDGILVDSTGFL